METPSDIEAAFSITPTAASGEEISENVEGGRYSTLEVIDHFWSWMKPD